MEKYILLIFLFNFSSQNCRVGCLMCEKEICIYCDIKEKYYRVGQICTQKIIDNCTSSQDGESCDQCKEGYYTDYSTGMCKQIINNEVENCRFYKLLNECIQCKSDFYLSNNLCVAVNTIVENCEKYSDKNTCFMCVEGMRLEDNVCVEAKLENCMNVGDIQCVDCEGEYMLNPNAYLYNLNIWNSDKKKKMNIYNLGIDFYSICAKKSVENCLVHESFYECQKCQEGFFLNPLKKCQQIPEEKINNCQEYLKYNYCRLCMEGYYKYQVEEVGNVVGVFCDAHSITIAFCKTFSNTNKDLCEQCDKDYYLESNNCVKRSREIKNCLKNSVDSDTCDTCVDDFLPNTEKTLCFAIIENCLTIVPSATELLCNQCIAQYIYVNSQKKCIPIQDVNPTQSYDNCELFTEVNQIPQCQKCRSQQYLDQSDLQCHSHSSFTFSSTTNPSIVCSVWSPFIKNQCTECDNDEILFHTLNYCEQIDAAKLDPNAVLYQSEFEVINQEISINSVPSSCKQGYYLKSIYVAGKTNPIKKCSKIIIKQCEQTLQGAECLKCQSTTIENYFLNAPGNKNLCIQSYEHIIQKCYLRNEVEAQKYYNSITKQNQLLYYNSCNQCFSPYYPVYFKNAQFCIPKNKLISNYEQINSIDSNYKIALDNCQIFKVELNQCYQCVAINGIQQVLSLNYQCTNSCATGTQIVTRMYPLSEDRLTMNFNSLEVKFFYCSDLKLIENCYRRSLIPLTSNNDFVAFKIQCMQCNNKNTTGFQAIAFINIAVSGAYIHVDNYNYQPSNANQHFKTKNQSYESPYENVISFSNCVQFTSEKQGSQYQDEISKKSFYEQSYIPSEPDYRQTSSFWQTCKAVGPIVNSRYYCISCNFGFYGYFLPISDSKTNYMIPQCMINESCEYGDYKMGLTSDYLIIQLLDDFESPTPETQKIQRRGFVNFWTACHICKVDETKEEEKRFPKIPTVTTRMIGKTLNGQSIHTKIASGTGFALAQADNHFYPSNFCTVPGFVLRGTSQEEYLSTNNEPQNDKFPKNCGVQFIVAEQPIKLFDLSLASNPFCLACSPGYKPIHKVLGDLEYKLIIECQKIENCDSISASLTTFNKCSKCASGYVLNLTDDECIQFAITNCYKGFLQTVDGNQVEKCQICEKGFAPNQMQNHCNKVELNNCLSQSFFSFNQETKTFYNRDTSVQSTVNTLMIKGQGCMECDIGFIAVSFNYEQKTCVKSLEIENRTPGVGVDDCFIYQEIDKCFQCKVGFVTPKDNQSKCILSSKIENCLEYEKIGDDYRCIKCIQKYILELQKCISGASYITNCLEFEYDPVENINRKTRCSKCDSGYVPLEKGDKKVCFLAYTNMNQCNEFQLLDDNKRLRCTQCSSGYYPKYFQKEEVNLNDPLNEGIKAMQDVYTEQDINQKIEDQKAYYSLQFCLKIPQVENCKLYNSSVDFTCIFCEDGYYLKLPLAKEINKLTLCEMRKSSSYANCDIIDPQSDSCQQCLNSYYVRNEQCRFKPSGVIGCVDYSDLNTCTKCRDNSYIAGISCRKVLDNLINKCLYYKNQFECMECEEGYLLIDNKCKAILISNCKDFLNEKECLICIDQYFLTDQKTCQQGQVGNCLIHASLSSCQQCNANYFVNEAQQCTAVPDEKIIPNCLYYQSSSICTKCFNKTVLAKNKASCIKITSATFPALYQQMDSKCSSYVFETNCRVCKEGYKFYDGKCTKCSESVKNCHFCDYQDDTVCHVCMTNFYQNNGQCISAGQVDDNLNEDIFVKKDWKYFSKDCQLLGLLKSFLFLVFV